MRPIPKLSEIHAAHTERLRGVRGQLVQRAWVVFDRRWQDLHPASPVVLELEGGSRLELWNVYVSDFNLTWNEIDLARTPFYWNGKADAESRWIVNGTPVLAAVLPNRIADVALLGEAANDCCFGVRVSFEDGQQLVVANYSDDLFIGSRLPSGRSGRSA